MPILPKRVPIRIGVVQLRPKVKCKLISIELENFVKVLSLILSIFSAFRRWPSLVRSKVNDKRSFNESEPPSEGYMFDSASSTSPYLEDPKTGPTSKFCQEQAQRLKCYVASGYPERLALHEVETVAEPSTGSDVLDSSQMQALRIGANSVIIYGPTGEWVGGYRKTHLFETDLTWAKSGTGFGNFTIPLPASQPAPVASDDATFASSNINITLGICMDLNPRPPATWTITEGPYELADHCIENNTQLLLLFNAWLDSGVGDEIEKGEDDDDDENNHDWQTLRYWAERLRPLWKRDNRRRGSTDTIYSNGTDDGQEEIPLAEDERPPFETIVVVCNRSGEENGKVFAGSSAIFSMSSGSGRPKLLDMMSRRGEGVRLWNLLI